MNYFNFKQMLLHLEIEEYETLSCLHSYATIFYFIFSTNASFSRSSVLEGKPRCADVNETDSIDESGIK